MAEQHADEILVFTTLPRTTQLMDEDSRERRGAVNLKIEALQANVDQFLDKVGGLVKSCPKYVGEFRLDGVEIHAEINGEGQVGLLGTGVTAGATAGITFVLSKRKV